MEWKSKIQPNRDLLKICKSKTESRDSLYDLFQRVFSNKHFKQFKAIHLYIHQKGRKGVKHSYIKKSFQKNEDLNIGQFSEFLKSIKNSRNKGFGEKKIKGTKYNIVGTFMSAEYNFASHHVIIALTREDFLEQSDLDKENFQQLIKVIGPRIEFILKLEMLQEKRKILHEIQSTCFEFHTDHRLNQDLDFFHQERIHFMGDLLNTLKHEVSNPLFGLKLSTELLMDISEEQSHQELLSQVNQAIERSLSLINDFKSLYQNSNSIDNEGLVKLVNEVFTLTKSEARGVRRSVSTDFDASHSLAGLDSSLLGQVLFNLILNSSQALNEQKIAQKVIDVSLVRQKNLLEIKVTDNAGGIPEEIKERVFTPFFTTKKSGTGLGLTITNKIVLAMGGELELSDAPDGSTFTIRFRDEYTHH